tara:strand:+ start:170 stop:436 length:267 start_codon:yes stop_codon:yes gene_type:complete
VLISLFEFVPLDKMGVGGDGLGDELGEASSLRALRVFRVLRVTKAMKFLSSVEEILSVFEQAAEDYLNFLLLLSISIFIFCLTGKEVS